MPIFEYKCNDCKTEFETLILGSEKPICKKCSSDNLEKKFSSFAVGSSKPDIPQCGSGRCGLNNPAQCPSSGMCGLG